MARRLSSIRMTFNEISEKWEVKVRYIENYSARTTTVNFKYVSDALKYIERLPMVQSIG